MYVLLVTWLVAGQPPSSYQTAFSSAQACNAARLEVLATAAAIRKDKVDAARRINDAMANALLMGNSIPTVSAVCATQGPSTEFDARFQGKP